jgi:hypothetical protein
MNAYSIALFLHIVGALGFFVALGLEWTGLWHIGNAKSSELVWSWMRISKSTRKLGILSMLAILLTGFFMMATVWGPQAWIVTSLGALVLGVVLTLALTGPRMMAVGKALAMGKGTLSPTFYNLAKNPILWISIQTRVGIGLAIVFLKIGKPGLSGSLLILGVAIVLGLVSALPVLRREQAQAGSAG